MFKSTPTDHSSRRWHLSRIVALAACIAACSGEPTLQRGPEAETVLDGQLTRVDNTRVDFAYVNPRVDYGRYKRVYLAPLLVDDIEIIQPSTTSSVINRFNREWELNEEDRARLQELFRDAMVDALSKNPAFTLTDERADDVIRIEGMITSIAPNAPRDDFSSRSPANTRVYTEGAGAMTIAILLRDGDGGEPLALINDTRRSSDNNWGINNRVTNVAEIRRLFATWSRGLSDGLQRLQSLEPDAGE
jgi:hypothetical protein